MYDRCTFGGQRIIGSQFLPSVLLRKGPLLTPDCLVLEFLISSVSIAHLNSTSAGTMHTWHFEWVPMTEPRTQVATHAWIVFLPTSLSHKDLHCFLFGFFSLCLLFSFWDKLSISSDCPQTLYMAEDDFKCPVLLLLPLTYWLSYYFRGKETPQSSQLIKHLIRGLLKSQSVSPWSSW